MAFAALTLALAAVTAAGAATSTPKPNVLFIVADDLGRNDLSHFNGGKSSTPVIDNLLQHGIFLESYYTFKVCSPTRTSIMSGRYAWRTGFYDMVNDAGHVLDSNYSMLPKLLATNGYSSHAIGKWNVGGIVASSTPTYNGFATFLGYYSACQADYYYHNGTCAEPQNGIFPVDMSFNRADNIAGAVGFAGNYSTHVYTQRAIHIVDEHATSAPGTPLFIYLAYQNVHLACGAAKAHAGGPGGIQAPCETISRFPKVTTDTFKAQSANMLELDWGIGNVTAAFKAAGLWSNTVFILVSDNGGPLDHTTNAPLRGGKHTFWEGGVRVVSFISGPLIPTTRRGTEFTGMLHSSDWYPTIVEGIAGGKVPDYSGPTPVDGFDVWTAIMTNATSPRTEVIHQVKNQYFNNSSTGYALRVGDYKLLVGNPGDNRIVAWPDKGDVAVAFGKTGGNIEGATGHCRAASGRGPPSPDPPDRTKCALRPCLFDVVSDPTETHDLAADPVFASTLKQLMDRLDAAGQEGPPLSLAYPFTEAQEKSMSATICANAQKTGFWEPVDVKPVGSN